jgi:thiamine biosynthesis lipoprotein
MAAELRFRAMGSDCHVVVVGNPALAALARSRVDDLERRWSRFRPDSEVSLLNGGAPRVVSEETFELVTRAVDGWRRTGGRFDPTVLGDVLRAGYDRTFAAVGARDAGRNGASALRRGCGGIEAEAATRLVRLPAGTGFDPGGIGKGLAADLVVRELLVAGAEGACVNVGGDVRVEGRGTDGGRWLVAVEHPGRPEPVAVVALEAGAVATSTTRVRTWVVAGERRHHLVDPASGGPYAGPRYAVTVVAREAAWAEVAAKAALLAPDDAVGTLARLGVDGIVAGDHGTATTPGLAGYLAGPVARSVR